jgi:two-component system sensor histidine kinase QseC
MNNERRFTADAAHELRTPIAAIRAQAQVALTESDDDARREALRATLEGCDRAARVVDQLLTLARLENDANPALEHVDLARLAREVLAEAAPEAQKHGQGVGFHAPAHDFAVRGSETLLKVLIRNLVDNALRYAGDGAAVEVSLSRGTGSVELVVADDGPGMARGDLERLGERFFRVSNAGASGSGLGWSIARRIAEVHGGSITARNRTPNGLWVTVTLPAGQ